MRLLFPIATVIATIVVFTALAYDSQPSHVSAELRRLGYTQVKVEPSPAFLMCGKNRWTYRFIAERQGRRVTGHACAGGFIGVSVNEAKK